MTASGSVGHGRWRSSAFPVIGHKHSLWLLGLAVAVSSHAAGAALLEWAESMIPAAASTHSSHGSGWSVLGWTCLFLASTVVFYRAFSNPHPSRLPSRSSQIVRAKGIVPWLWAALAVLMLFGVATAVHRSIAYRSLDHFSWRLALLYVLLFALALWRIAADHNQVLIVHTVLEHEMGDWARRSHLILTLSDVKPGKHLERDLRPSDKYVDWSDPPDIDADLEALVRAKTAKDDEEKRTPLWPWEMPLRAIREHRKPLEQVILLCSPESIVQAGAFARCVRSYARFSDLPIGVWAEQGKNLRILDAVHGVFTKDQGLDFNDVNALSSAMTDLLQNLTAVNRVPAAQIMVDFTGGKKPSSFVAAAATLRGEILAQYIDTAFPHKTLVYDLVANPEVRGVG